MKINGTLIADIPAQLSEMSNTIARLIELTCNFQPDIRSGYEFSEMNGVVGVYFEHFAGNIAKIYAGGVDISEIVSQGTWNACEEQAEQLYISSNAERRTASAQNSADIKAGK